jgi:hypothetical protein
MSFAIYCGLRLIFQKTGFAALTAARGKQRRYNILAELRIARPYMLGAGGTSVVLLNVFHSGVIDRTGIVPRNDNATPSCVRRTARECYKV